MSRQNAAFLAAMAVGLSEDIINGNMTGVIEALTELDGLESAYVTCLIMRSISANQDDVDALHIYLTNRIMK